MALARIKTWVSGEVLLASDLNSEFNNILNNALTLIAPLTASLNAGGFKITSYGTVDAPSSTTDVAQNSFTASGTGPNTRTLTTKLREIEVSVMDFKNADGSAVAGDGSQDDSTGIQRAVNAGFRVRFPKPSVKYKVTVPITIGSNTHLYGDAFSEIYQATTQIDTFQINEGSSGVVIERLGFSGTGVSTTGKASIHVMYTTLPSSDIVIRNNKFTNPSTCGVGTDPCNRVVVTGNIFNGCGDASIYASNMLDGTISNNVIISSTSYGILLRNGAVGGGRVAITGNVIRATGNAAGAGIFCADGSYKECSITGNVIMDSVGDGINFTQGAIAGKLSISGSNVITGCGNTAIQLASVTDAIISGNLIATSFLAGVYLGTGCRYNHIVGNKFFDCNTNNNAFASVYMIDTGDNVVTGNFIKTQYNNTNGVRNNGSANNFVSGNDVSQCAITAANRISGIVSTDIVRGNKGFVTENQVLWTITSGSTSVVVNHGCNRTPAAVNVTLSLRAESTADHGYIYVDTFTSTQMTVHCRVDPSTSGLFGQANIAIL